ncbi:MAG: MotA/TolQ/ExbB proton channel family protein [Planctomycetaceae bacterium]|nr:MotA/TolQ/ExbB proton channel family protein [Planctomycetaceae bacterium]
MFNSYFGFFSGLDWVIIGCGGFLALFQLFAIFMRYSSRRVFFVQNLGQVQLSCLQFAELLPVLGLIGTVAAMLNTFHAFTIKPDEGVEIATIVRTFAPAMTTTLSGLLMVVINLPLNQILFILANNKKNQRQQQ